ncbi:MAG: hypothetical protein IPG89_16535 [Bacteroidetes bacterium]|jgi:hypothetical protein|nr:hypothetical protein [Bacteroidota bacterium]
MRVFYTILVFLFLSVGFAQKSKLKGLWVEYKREVVGDSIAKEFNYKGIPFLTGNTYEFLNDSTYIFNSSCSISDCFIKTDSTIGLWMYNDEDEEIYSKLDSFKINFTENNKYLTLESLKPNEYLGYKIYLKRIKNYRGTHLPDENYFSDYKNVLDQNITDSIQKKIETMQFISRDASSFKFEKLKIKLYINKEGFIENYEILNFSPTKVAVKNLLRILENMNYNYKFNYCYLTNIKKGRSKCRIVKYWEILTVSILLD